MLPTTTAAALHDACRGVDRQPPSASEESGRTNTEAADHAPGNTTISSTVSPIKYTSNDNNSNKNTWMVQSSVKVDPDDLQKLTGSSLFKDTSLTKISQTSYNDPNCGKLLNIVMCKLCNVNSLSASTMLCWQWPAGDAECQTWLLHCTRCLTDQQVWFPVDFQDTFWWKFSTIGGFWNGEF